MHSPTSKRFRLGIGAGVRVALLAAGAFLAAFGVPALHAAAARALQSIDFVTLEGDRVLLTLTLSEAAPQPAVFAIDKPARLSIDLPATHLSVGERFRRINVGKVRSVAAAEAPDRTRVVVELSEMTPYSTRVAGNKVLVELAGAGSMPSAAAVAPVEAPSVPQAGTPAQIDNLDFRRGEKGEGRVLVTLSDPRSAADVREEGGRIVVRFRNTGLPERLSKRLDVLDFATPVKFVDAVRTGNHAEIVVTPIAAGDFDQTAYQTGNQFVIELQPLSQEKIEARRREAPVYTGERISLSFQSVDIRALLQIIADVAGTNMVVSDSVSGQIAMRLNDVPWDQALDIILRTKGLGMRREGNVMLVAPLEELAQREKVELEAQKQKVQLAPLRSEIVQVNYAKASELAALIKSKENSFLTERGSVTVDERTNSLLVLETRDKITEIRALVQKLDIPVRQVLIESRIVVANDNYDKELGTRFGVSYVGKNGSNGLYTISGTDASADTSTQSFLNNGRTGPVAVGSLPSTSTSGTASTGNGRYNINLPVTGAAGTIGAAILGGSYLVDLELSALQSEGRGEVISSPRVVTANGKQASIEQGVEIPYQNSTSSGATSVEFKKAVLSLNVTPQITPDERIIMDLSVNKDSIGQIFTTGTGGQVPSIDTRKVATQVLVDNGQTVVLGGIYEDTVNDTVTKVPLLGDIPLLGVLFRRTVHINNKDELLIFITPKILNESLKVK